MASNGALHQAICQRPDLNKLSLALACSPLGERLDDRLVFLGLNWPTWWNPSNWLRDVQLSSVRNRSARITPARLTRVFCAQAERTLAEEFSCRKVQCTMLGDRPVRCISCLLPVFSRNSKALQCHTAV